MALDCVKNTRQFEVSNRRRHTDDLGTLRDRPRCVAEMQMTIDKRDDEARSCPRLCGGWVFMLLIYLLGRQNLMLVSFLLL